MDAEQTLMMLKYNIQMTSTAFDAYLKMLIKTAKESIAREGIHLTDSYEDLNLVVMYAAYLWNKRNSETPEMPRMLRYALNNRLFAEKMQEGECGCDF